VVFPRKVLLIIALFCAILQGQMKLERQQILSLFIKVMKKFYKFLYGIASKEIDSSLPHLKKVSGYRE